MFLGKCFCKVLMSKLSMTTTKTKPVLFITGVTGYVGHHILEYIDKTYPSYVIYASISRKQPLIKSNGASKEIHYIKMDLGDDDSIKQSIEAMFTKTIPDIIIHCAAVTQIGFCEKNKDKIIKINYSTVFVNTLLANYKKIERDIDPLFILFSTDHVYDGDLSDKNKIKPVSMYMDEKDEDKDVFDESSPCYPKNNYGLSKLMMEKYLLLNWNNLVILRCSVIYGADNNRKDTLLQFVVKELKKEKETILFKNEKRNFVWIENVIQTVQYFMENYYQHRKIYHDIFNCGGSQTLSRVEFGEIVGKVSELNTKFIHAMNRYDCHEKWAKPIEVCKYIKFQNHNISS